MQGLRDAPGRIVCMPASHARSGQLYRQQSSCELNAAIKFAPGPAFAAQACKCQVRDSCCVTCVVKASDREGGHGMRGNRSLLSVRLD